MCDWACRLSWVWLTVYRTYCTVGRIHVRLRVRVKSHICAIGHARSLECGSLFGQIAGWCDHRHGLYEHSCLCTVAQCPLRYEYYRYCTNSLVLVEFWKLGTFKVSIGDILYVLMPMITTNSDDRISRIQLKTIKRGQGFNYFISSPPVADDVIPRKKELLLSYSVSQ